MVAAICGRYKPLLYSVCNAYLRKLSDKFKYWFFFYIFFATSIRWYVFTNCVRIVCVLVRVLLDQCVVLPTTCFKFMKITLIKVWQRKKIKLTLVLLRVHRKKNTEYTCKTI